MSSGSDASLAWNGNSFTSAEVRAWCQRTHAVVAHPSPQNSPEYEDGIGEAHQGNRTTPGRDAAIKDTPCLCLLCSPEFMRLCMSRTCALMHAAGLATHSLMLRLNLLHGRTGKSGRGSGSCASQQHLDNASNDDRGVAHGPRQALLHILQPQQAAGVCCAQAR